VSAQWPTPGDRREDHATQAGEAIGAIYAQAGLIIIAAIATIARKVAAGSMLPNVAARQVRATVTAVLSRAAPQARQVLTAAVHEASAQARGMITTALPAPVAPPESAPAVPISAQWTKPLAALIDQATDTAAQSAEDTTAAIISAVGQVADTGSAAAAGATARAPRLAITAAPARRALMPPPPPENPYTAALGRAFGHFNGFPGQSLSYRRLQAAQVMLDDLASRGITGFTDKAGRQWDLATYTEMATRTAVSNAWDDMQADAAVRSGLNLVETGTTSTEGSCPLCIPWLNRKLSLTGATEGYPTVDEAKAAGWRHPNCRCFWWVIGGGYMADVTNPVPIEDALEVYKHSQEQRAHERAVRAAGRAALAAITPQAKARAGRDLAAARAAAAAHRQQHQLRIMKVTSKRREAPYGPR
jgi:hypothetical protein